MTRSFRARIQKPLKRLLTLTAAAALAVPLLASPAHASGWAIHDADGLVTHSSLQLILSVPRSGATITCTGHDMDGSVNNPTDPSGQGAIIIDSHTFTNCTGPFGLTVSVAVGGTWRLNLVSITSDPDVYVVSVTNVRASISGPACSVSITGGMPGTYNNRTHILSLNPSAPNLDGVSLTAEAGSCLGVISTGDTVTWTADYEAFPPYTIHYTP